MRRKRAALSQPSKIEKGIEMQTVSICARNLDMGSPSELRTFYRQFCGPFHGNFWAMRRYYRIKRPILLQYLRDGRALA